MNSTRKDKIMVQPDFEEMFAMVDTIETVMREVKRLEVLIGAMEADTVVRATTDPSLSPDGKVLSATFVINTYKVTGIKGEITPFRYQLGEKESELSRAKGAFELMKLNFEMWRTEQANQRATSF